MSDDIASTFVQRHGVTLSTFQRLYSGSPSLHRGSYRTAALRSLEGYRRSCLSNRLLLYVDERIAAHRQEHTFLESPLELQDNPKILAARFAATCVRRSAAYDLTTTAGNAAIRELIKSWEPNNDLTLLKAILEEACCKYEALHSGAKPEQFLEIVVEMYSSAIGCQMPDQMRELIVSAMVLERLPGERFEESAPAKKLSGLLWNDFLNSVKGGQFDLAAVCLRSCAKLDPRRMLESLSDAVMNCAWCRVTELSLALELSKMRDDERLAQDVLEALRRAKAQMVPTDGKITAASVALGDLLRDLGLTLNSSLVVPMEWDEVAGLLAVEPPDVLRTVRAAIRTLRHIVPRATIEYFRRLEGERFILADAWPPPRQAAGPAFPVPSSFTHRLIGAEGVFFTRDLASETTPDARKLFERIAQLLGEKNALSMSMFVAELTAGARSEAAKPQVLGILRVQRVFPKDDAFGISVEEHKEITKVVQGACVLLGRPEATHVAKIGAWQYEHAVSGLGRGTLRAPERVSTLQVLADLMLELLEADLCRVAVHDLETRKWKSGPLSGKWWEGSRRAIDIADSDERSATVEAAKKGRPVIIQDVQKAGKSLPPNEWVRGCVALPLVREGAECDTVITLWHHAADWFAQFDSSLLDSLAAIGGARVHRVQAIELRTAHEQKQTIQTVSWHLAHTLKNYLPERPFIDLVTQVPESMQELAKDCLKKVKKVSSMRRRFIHLAQMDAFRPDGPHEAGALYSRLETCLREVARLFGLPIRSCTLQSFDKLVLCNLDFLEDDVLELVHNSDAHATNRGERPIELTFALRLATPGDLGRSSLRLDSGGNEAYAVIEYTDNGPGISAADKENIFKEKGGQISASLETESMGLGLPLARKLARKLDGDIVECGTPGVGVCFLIILKTIK
jgi:hypothetical protein